MTTTPTAGRGRASTCGIDLGNPDKYAGGVPYELFTRMRHDEPLGLDR